jgi:hypothetical protein
MGQAEGYFAAKSVSLPSHNSGSMPPRCDLLGLMTQAGLRTVFHSWQRSLGHPQTLTPTNGRGHRRLWRARSRIDKHGDISARR